MTTTIRDMTEAEVKARDLWTVTVVKPCGCVNCSAGQRWFFCVSDEPVVARYALSIKWQPKSDHPEIKTIQGLHPDCDLIY